MPTWSSTLADISWGLLPPRRRNQFRPDLILCPMLGQVIPRDLWETYPCLILHPGIVGDRGGNSLDWAIFNQESEWGVTVVQAGEHVDSGPIWAAYHCKLREASKSSLYRDEITAAAMKAMMVAVQRFQNRLFVPAPLDYSRSDVRGRYRPLLKPEQRRIDWSSDLVSTIVRKIRSADGTPGVLDEIGGEPVYLYAAHEEGGLVGRPGEIIAQRHGAVCRAAADGGVWISHLKRGGGADGEYFKLPATDVLGDRLTQVPEVPLSIDSVTPFKVVRGHVASIARGSSLRNPAGMRSTRGKSISKPCLIRSWVIAGIISPAKSRSWRGAAFLMSTFIGRSMRASPASDTPSRALRRRTRRCSCRRTARLPDAMAVPPHPDPGHRVQTTRHRGRTAPTSSETRSTPFLLRSR